MSTKDLPESDKTAIRDEPTPPRRIASRELFRTSNELIIEHGTKEYRLRITSSGKLILTA